MAIPRMARIWVDGELVDWEDARVHVLSPSLHTGLAVFEQMRAYPTDRGPAVFQHRAHVERLVASASVLLLDLPHGPDELMEATRELCRVNGQEAYHVRALAHLTGGDLDLDPVGAAVRVAIAVWPAGGAIDDGRGVQAVVSSWTRVAANAIPTGVKVAGAYVQASLAEVAARRAGADTAVVLNEHGRVAGGSATDLFVVRDGVLLTPPTAEGAMGGITRAAVLDLAREADIPTDERPLLRHDLYTADEAFLTGTTVEILPLRSVDERRIGPVGPVTKQLAERFRAVVRGRDPKYDHMLDYVAGAR
jgi:branched-chain amino acid aminotransferase